MGRWRKIVTWFRGRRFVSYTDGYVGVSARDYRLTRNGQLVKRSKARRGR